MKRYTSYGRLSKTTNFLSVSCEAGVIQQRTEAQAGVVQDGLRTVGKLQALNNDKYVRVQNKKSMFNQNMQ